MDFKPVPYILFSYWKWGRNKSPDETGISLACSKVGFEQDPARSVWLIRRNEAFSGRTLSQESSVGDVKKGLLNKIEINSVQSRLENRVSKRSKDPRGKPRGI